MRVAQRIQPLADLENSQLQARGMTVAESAVPQGKNLQLTEPVVSPQRAGVWLSEQTKYAEDIVLGLAKWWRRAFFWYVYRPFVWFSYKVVGVYPPDGTDQEGRLLWLERQGSFVDEWRAIQDAARFRFGFTTWMPLDDSVESDTCTTIQITPHTPWVLRWFRRNGHRTVDVHEQDLKQLRRLNEEADKILDQYQANQ